MHYFVFITNTVCVSMIKSFAKLQIISETEKQRVRGIRISPGSYMLRAL